MAPQLRRGIPGYAEGDTDVPQPNKAFVADRSAPIAPVRVDVPSPATATPSGFGQLMGGVGQAIWNRLPGTTEQPPTGFAAARDNPASSPLTSTLGQFADYLSRDTRAQQVAAGPSLKDWMTNLFAGDTASTEALKQRTTTATALKDPLTQSYLTSHPDQLAIAEKDPRGYAAVSTDPGFRETMAKAVNAHVEAAANPRVNQDEHPQVVKDATDKNVSATQAHAATATNKYTEDEFVKLFTGMPMKHFLSLFGQQMGHVGTPQEKAAIEVIDRLHGTFAKADDKVKKMEADIAEATKNKTTSPHVQAPWFGTSPYDAAKTERDKAYNATMEVLKAAGGITARSVAIPGQGG